MSDASRSSGALPIPSRPASEIRRQFIEFFADRGHTVVPSASLVPAGDPTLLFTNSGMVQFKDVLRGVERRSYQRAVDAQRCLRVAGKHNDFEEVGRTPRHHTLFEMLGNWSFGDYFKREAIHWAWELLTEVWGIPAERLAATTYTDDDEAHLIWRDEIGLPPERMARWGDIDAGDDKNFWRMAEIGPCGPCSEIHFDRGAHLSEGPDCVPDHSETCSRWLEVWNLVFMQYEQHPDGRRTELPFKSVDTGMGLERVASVIQQVPTNYDTDLFTPIHQRMREITGDDLAAFEAGRFSYQVIADHSRAITFMIADGVLPTNEGRGYVLRRILRRAVRHGRLLGRTEPFLTQTASVVIEMMEEAYPYLRDAREGVLGVIQREEAQFARTLEAGMNHLDAALEALLPSASDERSRTVGRRAEDLPVDAPVLDGAVAFRLADTYGFPVDLTVELAAERGVAVDRAGFEEALAEQRARSRMGAKSELSRLAQQQQLYQSVLRRGETAFVGYETTSAEARVIAILRDGMELEELASVGPTPAEVELVLDRTPFYPEGGGQVGDQGELFSAGSGVPDGNPLFSVRDTQRPIPGLIVHRGGLHGAVRLGDVVRAEVDATRRRRTMRNHTATHVLHRALRNTIGEQARQAGSLVGPDYLRFDYPADRPLTPEERRAVEAEVREIVRGNLSVEPEYMTMAEAVAQGADAFFDEKYGETVRTIRIEDYSHELCGGTHCVATGQIGEFVITGERSIGAGLRRIEALTGDAADAFLSERLELLDRITRTVGAQTVAAAPDRVAELQARVKELERRLREGAGGSDRIPRPAELAAAARRFGGTRIASSAMPFETMEQLKAYAKDLRGALGDGLIVLALDAEQPQLFVTVSDDLVARGVSAGALVQVGAAKIEGRGGGKPQMAQARGVRRDGIPDAFAAMQREVERLIETDDEDGSGEAAAAQSPAGR